MVAEAVISRLSIEEKSTRTEDRHLELPPPFPGEWHVSRAKLYVFPHSKITKINLDQAVFDESAKYAHNKKRVISRHANATRHSKLFGFNHSKPTTNVISNVTKCVNQIKRNPRISALLSAIVNQRRCTSRTHPRICVESHLAQDYDHACIAFSPCTSNTHPSITQLTCNQNMAYISHFLVGTNAY